MLCHGDDAEPIETEETQEHAAPSPAAEGTAPEEGNPTEVDEDTWEAGDFPEQPVTPSAAEGLASEKGNPMEVEEEIRETEER